MDIELVRERLRSVEIATHIAGGEGADADEVLTLARRISGFAESPTLDVLEQSAQLSAIRAVVLGQ